ncbi:MAG: hypothetical protein ACE5FU_03180, partial [Nitrospinota bacterium]
MNLSKINDIRIGSRVLAGFFIVTTLLIIIGVQTLRSMGEIDARTVDIIQTSPLVNAAMEMKLSVSRNLLVTMKILNSKKTDTLKEELK